MAKKLLAIILMLCMCVAIFGTLTVGAESNAEKELGYVLSDDSTYYIVNGIGSFEGKDVVIPEEYKGKPVREIAASSFSNCTAIESIYVPATVQRIGKYAFSNCSNLASATIKCSDVGYCYQWSSENAKKCYGYSIFHGCSSLEYLYISDVEFEAYLSSVYNYINYYPLGYLFGMSSYDGSVACSQPHYIGDRAEYGYRDYYFPVSLKSITLGEYGLESYTGKGYTDPFKGCDSINEIIIDDGITEIAGELFSGMTGLTDVVIPDSVATIGDYAFEGCTRLANITIPDSVVSIGRCAFSDTGYYNNSANWRDGALYIENNLIEAKTTLSGKFNILSGTKAIANYAFYGCGSLTGVTIPDSVISIGSYAFDGCDSLTGVYITDVEAWCNVAFGDSTSVTNPLYYAGNLYLGGKLVKELAIPDGVVSICDSAFENCCSLTSITIPDSVISIGSYAFYGCSSLASVTITDSVNFIGRYAFANTAYFNNTANWENNVLYIGNSLIVAKSSVAGSYKIRTGTKTIANYAFSACTSLTAVTIPDSVSSIGEGTFRISSLEKVNITDIEAWCNITFGDAAANPLSNAENLYLNDNLVTELIIPDGVVSIKDYAFCYCSKLTSIVIPDSVTSIGERAFYYCNKLASVTMSDNVTAIDEYAFNSCYALKTVYYTGTEEEFTKISISSGNDYFKNADIIYLNGMDAIINSAPCTYADNEVSATVKFDCVAEAGTLYLALYDGGKLVAINDAIVALGETEKTIEIENVDESYIGYDVKVFYWEEGNVLSPLAKTFESKVQ